MKVNTQIDRGMERLIARNESARLEGLFGLAGLSEADNFNSLEGLLEDTGFSGASEHVKLLRRRHKCLCDRMKAAVPVAADAMRLMEENDSNLSGIFSKVGKAIKKVAKVAVKLSPSHAIIKKIKPLAKLSPALRVASGTTPLIAMATAPKPVIDPAVKAQMAADKVAAKQAKKDAAAAKKAAAAAAKQAKKDAKAAAALVKAGVSSGTAPVDAGAAVLASQTGVNFTTEQAAQLAQQVAANIAQPGSAAPTASMFNDPGASAPSDAASSGTGPFGLPMPVVIGGTLLAAGAIYMATRKKGRR